MIEGPILPDTEFIHERTGVLYVALFSTHSFVYDESELKPGAEPEEQTLVKIGDGEWTPAVVYCDPAKPNMTFVRDEAKFRENFRRA